MTKNGTAGMRRSVNRYCAPSLATPALIAASCRPKRSCTQSRSTKREATNADVAPSEEAKDTITVPHPNPKIAPAASVMMTAPGSDSPVTAT